ncbi:MAG: LPS export ABC transporter permease LptF [Steroidobacteraceae bacterium]
MTRGIFFRHALRDVAAATLLVGVVLLAVLVIYQLAFVLGRAADGQVPGDMVLQLVWLSLRSNLPVILPFAVLLGVVSGLGRLYHDSEISAAQACGVGNGPLYAAAGVVTLAAAVLAAWIAFFDGPAAARGIVEMRLSALRTAATRALAPGAFRSLGEGATLSFRSQNAEGLLQDVFVQRELPAQQQRPARMQVVLARAARYAVSPDSRFYLIDLQEGRSYEGTPGAGDWRITRFSRQQLRIPTPQMVLPGKPRVDVLGNRELLAATAPRQRGELHWRIAWVVNVLVLGMLAVPLARLLPRQGRHARLPAAVLLFAVYAGLLSAGRTLFERGEVPPWLGLWWVHALAVALGCGLLAARRLRLRR